MTPAGLASIREATARLRDPETPPAEAARLASETPMILWLMGNVHGGEESGTDAELRVLELADRTDAAQQSSTTRSSGSSRRRTPTAARPSGGRTPTSST